MIKNKITAILIALLTLAVCLLSSCTESPSDTSSAEVSQPGENISGDIEGAKKVYPKIKEYTESDKIIRLDKVKIESADAFDEALNKLKAILSEKGITVSDTADFVIKIGKSDSAPEGENYTLECNEKGINLYSKGKSGQIYAAVTLKNLIGKDKKIKAVKISDGPEIPFRGIVEGFYGKPWSFEDRKRMIEFCGDVKMNTYIYAPKDDAKHRDIWREKYDEKEISRLKELISLCNENGVKFVYALSPGVDFNYSFYDSEFKLMCEKYEQVYNLGVRDFALMLDDLHIRDRQAALNHTRLVNDFRREFYKDKNDLSELITIFAQYYDTIITEEYTGTIAKGINKDVMIMWTGPGTAVRHLNASSFNKPNELFGRKMFFWWNYPVNDFMPDRLFFDRVSGLSANLKDGISGMVSNPMNQAYTSQIVLFTLADYLWNPEKYSSPASFDAACEALCPNCFESVKFFSQTVRAGYINDSKDSEIFDLPLRRFKAGNYGDAEKLFNLFDRLEKSAIEILNDKTVPLHEEIAPWLLKASYFGRMGKIITYTAQNCETMTESDKAEGITEFKRLYDLCENSAATVSAYIITPFFEKAEDLFEDFAKLFDFNLSLVPKKVTTNFLSKPGYGIENIISGNLNTSFISTQAPIKVKGGEIIFDFGKSFHIENIFALSGNNFGSADELDRFMIEYSENGKDFTEIPQSFYSDLGVFFKDDFDFDAQYIKFKIPSGKFPVVIKAVEFNTRRPIPKFTVKSEKANITSTLPSYGTNFLNNALIYGEDKVYRSSSGAGRGFYTMLDLGEVKKVHNIMYLSGITEAPTDYIRHCKIQYSKDKINWTDIGTYETKDIIINGLDIDCRYIRAYSDEKQDFWLSLSYFGVNNYFECKGFSSSALPYAGHELFRLTDSSAFTSFKADVKKGDFVKADSDLSKAEKLGIISGGEFFPKGAKIFGIENESKKLLGTIEEKYQLFDIPAGSDFDGIYIEFTSDARVEISEIFVK